MIPRERLATSAWTKATVRREVFRTRTQVALLFIAIPILLLGGGVPAFGTQSDSLAALKARVAQLETKVRRLEVMVGTDTIAAPYRNAKWVQPANWEKLSIGMSKQQVQDLLGPPMVNGGSRWDWSIQGYGGAYVTFSGDVIQEWQAPPFYSEKFVRKVMGVEQ